MLKQKLNYSSWIAFLNSVIMLPILFIMFYPSTNMKGGVEFILIFLFLVNLISFIVVFSTFKELFNFEFSFHEVDKLIKLLIFLNIGFTLGNILQGLFPQAKVTIGTLNLLLIVPFGIVLIMFSVKLKKIKDTLYDLLNPLFYATILAGFGIGSLILLPFGFIATSAYNVIFGIIFIRASEKFSGQNTNTA